MDHIHIRPYEERDWPAIQEAHDLARRGELRLAGLDDAFLPLEIAALREGLFDYLVDVAEADGRVVGFIACSEDELAWLYVHPDVQRRGVGAALCRHALARRGNAPMELEVLVGNEPARALYQRLGFAVTGTVSGVMPGNERFPVRVWCMEHRPE